MHGSWSFSTSPSSDSGSARPFSQTVFEQSREELPLDGHRAAPGDAGEQAPVEHVDAGVDGVGRDLRRIRLLDEAPDAAALPQLHQAEGGGVGHPREVQRGRRAARLVEGEHRAEVGIGEDVAVEHEHAPVRDVHRVAHPARGAERLVLHRIRQPHAPGGTVAHGGPHRVHHVGAGQHRVPDPMAREQRELVGEKGNVEQRDDRLGPIIGERPEPGALATREDDGGYLVGAQGSASEISITGMPSRMG